MIDPANEYPERLAKCLANGHQPVMWRMSATTRVLCQACGRTWPQHWLRLVTMANIAPVKEVA